jgi:hypothetical protein
MTRVPGPGCLRLGAEAELRHMQPTSHVSCLACSGVLMHTLHGPSGSDLNQVTVTAAVIAQPDPDAAEGGAVLSESR